jgi:polysaccharide export outer membrane protein
MRVFHQFTPNFFRSVVTAVFGVAILGGCSTYPSWIPSSGPSKSQVENVSVNDDATNIQLVDVSNDVTRRLIASRKTAQFSELMGNSSVKSYSVNPGDIIEVSIWEAPPALLFGSATAERSSGISTSNVTKLPEQMVSNEGAINVPFAGQIRVSGLTPREIEVEIVKKLKGLANQPQVLVRTIANNTSNVTVIGEVASSTRMGLTARGERLLDALAAAGGVRQPVNKMTLQVTRGNQVAAMPLETIIRDPKQNITLQPGDVVTSLFQSLSYTVLGAAGKNEEINFESKGISLAQAIARAGGLQDHRADAQGVFIFRFESPEALGVDGQNVPTTPEGKVPVIYRVNLKDPATFFVAQNFPIEDKDLMYVSNASAAELQKFLNIVMGSVVYPILTVKSLTN